MNSRTKILAAVVAVALVAIAAVALCMGNDGDEKKTIPDTAGTFGTVYGNADGNCVIDDIDIDIIEDIISGKRSLSDYPFADADNDGSVDQTDLQTVKDIIAKKSMKVKVLNTEGNVIDVQYPVKKFIVLAGSNLAPLMNILDATDRISAAAYSKLDSIRDRPVCEGIENGSIVKLTVNGTAADMDAISKLKDTHVMLTENGSHYDLDSDKNIKTLNAWNIDVLRMDCRDPGDDTRTMAVFGILLDKGAEVQSYIDFADGVYEDIKKIEGDSFGTARALICGKASNGLSGKSSGYTAMVEKMAGGHNVADWEESSKKFENHDPALLADKYDADVGFFGTGTYYDDDGFSAKAISGYEERYSHLDAWKNGDVYIFSTSMPVLCRVAYFAEAMYPDLFEKGWANGIHQEFVNRYFDAGFTVEEGMFFKKIN